LFEKSWSDIQSDDGDVSLSLVYSDRFAESLSIELSGREVVSLSVNESERPFWNSVLDRSDRIFQSLSFDDRFDSPFKSSFIDYSDRPISISGSETVPQSVSFDRSDQLRRSPAFLDSSPASIIRRSVAFDATQPPNSPTSEGSAGNVSEQSIDIGLVVGIAAAIVVLLAVVIFVVLRRRRKPLENKSEELSEVPSSEITHFDEIEGFLSQYQDDPYTADGAGQEYVDLFGEGAQEAGALDH
jgi:hypothetical protein